VVVKKTGNEDLQTVRILAMESVMGVKEDLGCFAASTRTAIRLTALRQRGLQRYESMCAGVTKGFMKSEGVRPRAL
jgi:hypothetical protein